MVLLLQLPVEAKTTFQMERLEDVKSQSRISRKETTMTMRNEFSGMENSRRTHLVENESSVCLAVTGAVQRVLRLKIKLSLLSVSVQYTHIAVPKIEPC
jgi:hypothetical protein